MPTITDDQLKLLQQKVSDIVAAKGVADSATAAANAAGSALVLAQQQAADAQSAEATADGQLTADVQDLESFIVSIAGPLPAPTP